MKIVFDEFKLWTNVIECCKTSEYAELFPLREVFYSLRLLEGFKWEDKFEA